MAAFLITLASNVSFMNLINEVGAVRLPFWNSGSTCTPRVYHRIFFHVLPLVLKWATDEIICFGKMPSSNGGAPYGSCRFWICIPYYWLWSFREPLQSSKATSYSNFVYSNHVGVMQWAHNSSAAALSHQVSDLRMWSCENVNYTTWGPRCVSSTCNISWHLSTFDIVLFHLATMALVLG